MFQLYIVKPIKSILPYNGIVKQGLGHLYIILSSSHFFNKTDLEQFLFKIAKNSIFSPNSSSQKL